MTLGDHVLLLCVMDTYSKLVPQDVFNRPANLFVAGSIIVPQMNFFDAHLVRVGNEVPC